MNVADNDDGVGDRDDIGLVFYTKNQEVLMMLWKSFMMAMSYFC